MSRYIKSISATRYTGKKSYLNATSTSFNIPAGSTEAKVLVFGGGGNSCSTLVSETTQFNCCNNSCCQCCRFGSTLFQTGAGGGYTERTYSGVSGSTACVIVGGSEGTSSFCIATLGTITATGATATGSAGSRTTVPGCGICGDINRCGGPGSCDTFCFCECCNMCFMTGPNCFLRHSNAGMLMSGASPGNTVANGCCGSVASGVATCCYFCCRTTYYYGYGCTIYTGANVCRTVYTSYSSGAGACPISSDTYYGFDWDIIGGSIVCTAAMLGQTVGATACYNCFIGNNTTPCCINCCVCYCVSAAGQATLSNVPGVTGSGGPGNWTGGGYNGFGGIGGGGAGICLPFEFCGPASSAAGRTASGGSGMIIVYY